MVNRVNILFLVFRFFVNVVIKTNSLSGLTYLALGKKTMIEKICSVAEQLNCINAISTQRE